MLRFYRGAQTTDMPEVWGYTPPLPACPLPPEYQRYSPTLADFRIITLNTNASSFRGHRGLLSNSGQHHTLSLT
jgi:hypothetical protein